MPAAVGQRDASYGPGLQRHRAAENESTDPWAAGAILGVCSLITMGGLFAAFQVSFLIVVAYLTVVFVVLAALSRS